MQNWRFQPTVPTELV